MARTLPLALTVAVLAASAWAADPQQGPFGPGDPVARDATRFDPRRPVGRELQTHVPDGFAVAAVGDLIISRPVSQSAARLPGFAAVLAILRQSDVALGNLETTIFEARSFGGSPYSWDGDWTNASVPAVAQDLKAMGFSMVARANNHSQDWGLEGMRQTSRWLDEAGLVHAGVGETHALARAPGYFESPAGRIALVSVASSFRPTSESLPATLTAPGRPGVSALHLTPSAQVPQPALVALAQIHCALEGRHCDGVPSEGELFGTRYERAETFSYEHSMDSRDLAEIYRSIRSAQENADFVIVSIHAHECSVGCEDDAAPRGPAHFLKELARGAIDSGADVFVVTGNHNLGPIEIYDSPARGPRPILYGLGNFFWSDVQELMPYDLFQANQELLAAAWKDPARATGYDLTAVLNKEYFAHPFTFQSVVAEVRFAENRLSELVLHPVEEGYGERLTESGIPRLVTDEARAREIFAQITEQTARFGLPELEVRYSHAKAVIRP